MMDWSNIFWWPFAATLGVIGVLIGIIAFILWIWMIVDAAKRRFRNDVEKVIWIVVVVLGGWLGALVYYIVIRSINPSGLFKR